MKRIRMLIPGVALTALLLLAGMAGALGETTAALKDFLPYEGGYTTIAWDVTGDDADSYVVYQQVINNGTAKQARRKVGSTTGHSIKSVECLPGKCYEITLTDGRGNQLDKKAYQMDDPEVFSDGKLKNTSIKVSVEPRSMKTGENPKKTKSFKAAEIKEGLQGGGVYYGMKYQMKMPQLVKERSFFVTLAFESPDGYLYVEQAADIKFDRVNNGYQTLWWNFAGAEFFLSMYLDNQDIPEGEYTIYLYWDGYWVNTMHFKVK